MSHSVPGNVPISASDSLSPVSSRRYFLATSLVALLSACSPAEEKKEKKKDLSTPLQDKSSMGPLVSEKKWIPSLPLNRFSSLPTKPHTDDGFVKKVKKVTLEQRKAKMIATNGGGRASNEVEYLQKLWLRPFDTLLEIQTAYKTGKLIDFPSIDNGRYFAVGIIGSADPKNKVWYNLIHPEAYQRFNEHVAQVFYAETGKMLKVTGLVRSEEYQEKLRQGNIQATKKTSPHTFGRTIDFSIPELFNPKTGKMEPMSPDERKFISQLLTYYELNFPWRTSWLVENANAYHGTHYPLKSK